MEPHRSQSRLRASRQGAYAAGTPLPRCTSRRVDSYTNEYALPALALLVVRRIGLGGGVFMRRAGAAMVGIAVAVSGAVAVIVAILALFASHAIWVVLPVTGILAGMGIVLGVIAWQGSGSDTRSE